MSMEMERSIMTINEYGSVILPEDISGIWMNEPELVELFGVIAPTLRTTVKAVYKSGVLQSCEVERCIKQPNGYGVDVYALPMVVALAFRIGTPNAERVRNALLERLCLRKEKQLLWTFIRGSAYEC